MGKFITDARLLKEIFTNASVAPLNGGRALCGGTTGSQAACKSQVGEASGYQQSGDSACFIPGVSPP